jgi:hypothetical protein
MNKSPVYFRNGKIVAESGDIKIYKSEDELYMENKPGNLISYEGKKKDYVWQLGNRPFGKVLVLGLGLGVSARYIFSLQKVEEVVIMEKDSDIINAVGSVNNNLEFYKIIKVDDYLKALYENNSTYDFIFLDCYTKVDGDTLPLIADLVNASRRILTIGHSYLSGWLPENTEETLVDTFFDLFNLK